MTDSRTRTFVVLTAVAALAVTAAVAIVIPATSPEEVEAAVFFSLAAFVAHSLAYKLPGGGVGDIAFIPLLSGVAIVPRLDMVIGTFAAILCGEYFRHRDPVRMIFNAAQFTVAVGLSMLVYVESGGEPLTAGEFRSAVPFIAAYATFFVSNAVFFAGVMSVSSQKRFISVLSRVAGGATVIFDLLGMPIVFGFGYAYMRIGWVWSGALLIPLAGLRQIYKANRELQNVNEELLQLMVAAIEARDPYTSGHSQRVAAYSRVVARAAGLSARAEERVFTAALLHDVGKIHEEFAPILRKPGRLTDDEFDVMKTHSAKGAALVGRVTQFEDLVPAVLGHHEAWDGTGYPNRLRAENIPLWARVIAIADTIDAMTTDRPYRKALTPDAVRAELTKQSGHQFDPALVGVLTSDKAWPEMTAALAARREQELASAPRHSASLAQPVGA